MTLDEIREIDRYGEPPVQGLMCDLLWADPKMMPGRAPSKRGVSCMFGPDVTQRFLDDNGLKLLVRSHEVKPDGYEVMHDGRCITVFSAPNYCDQVCFDAFVTRASSTIFSEFFADSFCFYTSDGEPWSLHHLRARHGTEIYIVRCGTTPEYPAHGIPSF